MHKMIIVNASSALREEIQIIQTDKQVIRLQRGEQAEVIVQNTAEEIRFCEGYAGAPSEWNSDEHVGELQVTVADVPRKMPSHSRAQKTVLPKGHVEKAGLTQ